MQELSSPTDTGGGGHSLAREQDSGPQGELSAAAESHPRLLLPLGISGLESRRVALWFLFLPWG